MRICLVNSDVLQQVSCLVTTPAATLMFQLSTVACHFVGTEGACTHYATTIDLVRSRHLMQSQIQHVFAHCSAVFSLAGRTSASKFTRNQSYFHEHRRTCDRMFSRHSLTSLKKKKKIGRCELIGTVVRSCCSPASWPTLFK